MTENLAKIPAKGILRKSSLTFIEHDDSDFQFKIDAEKPTKVIVEPVPVVPTEYPGETAEEKARREEFELKRKLLQHQEGLSVHMAKRLLSDENIEEETETTQEEDDEDDASDASDANVLDSKESCSTTASTSSQKTD